MPYFSYSPWNDAAAYGRGLGDTLAKAMLEAPQKREDLLEQRQAFPLQQDLLRARIQEALAQPELRQLLAQASMTRAQNQGAYQQGELGVQNRRIDTQRELGQRGNEIRQQQVDISKQRADTNQDLDKTKMALNEIDAALAQARIGKMEEPKQQTPGQRDEEVKKAFDAEKMVAGTQPANAQPALSVSLANVIAQLISQPGNTNTSSELAQKALVPFSVNPAQGWFGKPTTNNASFDVSKIGASLGKPLSVADQPMANAPEPHFGNQSLPPPNERPVGLKTTTPKGTFMWDGSGWVPVQQ